ncbi:MAG: hypothetical protein RJQ04_14580 [Longimicrobiales bacterium]
MRDSAGVRVVEIGAPPRARLVADLVQAPLELSALPSPPHEIVAWKARPRGGFLLAEADGRVSLWHDDGALEAAWGGAGEGPGEFRMIADVATDPDGTLRILDPVNVRVTRTTSVGAVLHSWQMASPWHRAARLVPGGYVAAGPASDQTPPEPGYRRRPHDVVFVREAGEGVEHLTRTPGYGAYRVGVEDGRSVVANFAFVHPTLFAASDMHFATDRADGFVLGLHRRDGSLQTVIDATRLDRSIPAGEIEAAFARAEDRWGAPATHRMRGQIASALERVRPPIGALLFSTDGEELWVGLAPAWRDEPPTHWWVFDTAGRPLFELALPPVHRLMSVDGDRLFAVAVDGVGVERPVLLTMER